MYNFRRGVFMKKKYFTKVLSLAICLSIVFSTVASAKTMSINFRDHNISCYAVDPHPDEGGAKK